MIIDFNNIEEVSLPAFQGGEKQLFARMYADGLNKIMKGRLVPGATIGLHTHETSSEILFVTKGCGHVIYDGESTAVKAGDIHYCPKGHAHTFINDSDSEVEIIAVVPQQ